MIYLARDRCLASFSCSQVARPWLSRRYSGGGSVGNGSAAGRNGKAAAGPLGMVQVHSPQEFIGIKE
jgi:hypothetical protein